MGGALHQFEGKSLKGFTGVFEQHHRDEDEVLHWDIEELSALTKAPACRVVGASGC